MTTITWLTLLVGVAVLTAGAEGLVRGSSKLAAAAGISPLVIGLTVVAHGTSTPELAVSVKSAWAGQSDIALGNVIGSNVCNVLLILGACALANPLNVSVQLIRLDVPIMIASSALIPLIGFNGSVGRLEGTILLALMIWYNVFIVRKSRQETKAALDEFASEFEAPLEVTPRFLFANVVLLIVGFALLVIGARMFVNAAVVIAQAFGFSELVIGLTIVAVGTSLPEVATSLIATIRGERDIAIGNVVGSNIYNVLAVLGATAAIKPVHVPEQALYFDIPIMIAISVACLPIFFTGMSISRWEGALFLGYYVAYTAYLVMQAQLPRVPPVFKTAMLYFILPITVVTICVLTLREIRVRLSARESAR